MRGLGDFYRYGRVTGLLIVLFPLLLVLSFAYQLAVWGIRFLYSRGVLKSLRPESRVISVGNITLGGSGKTPLTEYLARTLEPKTKVAVLLRGYRRPASGPGGQDDYSELGDEGSLLKENLGPGIIVQAGVDRAGLVRKLESGGFRGVLLLDDGFQHWRIRRDLDIVCLDASMPFGNGLLLPAGHLRETRQGLRRAGVFCLTRCDQVEPEVLQKLERILKEINPAAAVIHTIHAPEYFYDLKIKTKFKPESLTHIRSGIVCGIARPQAFVRTLEDLHLDIRWKKFFSDHHSYTRREILDFSKEALSRDIRMLVTTQKDAQRLKAWVRELDLGLDILVLRIGLRVIRGQEELDARLHSVCGF
ncbi:MAG: tetraacyldisaccharide 4'-kinase [Candidatus Omnitrophota bacterium]